MNKLYVRLYRAALGFYPVEFRRAFEQRMLVDFERLLAEVRTPVSRLAVTLRETIDVIRAARRERRMAAADAGAPRSTVRDRLAAVRDDVAFAIRTLRARPAYALVSIATLALAIAANAVVFSVVDQVVIRPLSYDPDDRMVYLFANDLSRERPTQMRVPVADFLDWKRASRSFKHMVAGTTRNAVLTEVSPPERIRVGEMLPEVFAMLAIPPLLGNHLGADSPPDAVVMAHAAWIGLFGGDADIVGRAIVLDGVTHTVVGVMPAGFRPPVAESAAVWRALRFSAEQANDRGHRTLMVTALRLPGVTNAQALADVSAIAERLAAQHPETNATWGVHLLGAKEIYLQDSRAMYGVLGAAVVLVLLVACVNLASLVLARGAARQGELGLRLALGAGRLRVVRLLVAEGAVIAGAGALLGVVLGMWGLAAILQLAPTWPALLRETTLTARSIGVAFGLAGLALVLFSALPALGLSRSCVRRALTGTRAASGTAVQLGTRRTLVVAQIALAVTLLVGAALLVRSVINIIGSDNGFDYRGVLSARLSLIAGDEGANVYFDEILERAAALPGVETAALTDSAPMDGTGAWAMVFVDGERVQEDRALGAEYRRVSMNYFDTLRVELRAGRLLRVSDADERNAVINEDFARRFLRNREPLGATFELAPSNTTDPGARTLWRVVGVVKTVREWGPTSFDTPSVYVPHTSDALTTMTILLRTVAETRALVEPLRELVGSAGGGPMDRVETLESYFHGSYEGHRFMLALLGTFAALAATLAAIGLYGVMAYGVAARRQEIGIRVALGAARGDVVGMVARDGARMALFATAIGLLGAVPLGRALSTLLMGRLLVDMHWFDPTVFAAVPLLVFGIAALAAWLPARSAARVDPVRALRAEV